MEGEGEPPEQWAAPPPARPVTAWAGPAWPVIGRDAELRALNQALGDVACGGVALVGAPGFGKTRLAMWASELVAQRALPGITLRATASGRDISLGALSPLFAALGVAPQPDADLFGATLEGLRVQSGGRRWVLVVDDAHQLDEASMALLEQLVAGRHVFVVLTARTGEAATDALVSMWKEQQLLRIEVGPLPDRDLRTLATTALGGPIDGGTLQALVESSAGNVLFLRELVKGATESGALTCEAGLWRLAGSLAGSSRLRDLIGHRLGALEPEDREVLELVALGEPLPLAIVERLVPLPVVERLEHRGLVDAPNGEWGPEVRLNHPLYGDVLRTHLPPLRRVRLSRSLADAAEAGGELRGPEVLRVALWRLEGGGRGRLETTLAGAQSALRREDYAVALRLSRAAWEHWRSTEAALVLGEALDFLGHSAEAEAVLAEAVSASTLSDEQRTALSVRRASVLFRALDQPEEADRVIEEVSVLVSDRGCRRELSALKGDHLLLSGQVGRAITLDRAILDDRDENVGSEKDAAFAQASLDLGTALALAGRSDEAIAHTGAALAARTDLEDREQLSAVGVYLVAQSLARFYRGDLEGAAGIGEAGYQVAVEKKNLDGQAWFASMLGLIRLGQGRPASSANLFREVAALFKELNHPGRRWGLGGLALACAHLGDRDGAEAAVAELAEVRTTSVRLQDVGVMRGEAWTSMLAGRASDARRRLWEAVEQAERWGQHAAASEAVHDLVRMGSSAEACERLEQLSEVVDGPLMEARATFARAVREGDPKRAEQAGERFEVLGALLFAAEAAKVEAQLSTVEGLHRRSSAAEARARRLLERCEGARLPWLSTPTGGIHLSEREREVALLAAGGMTSRQIADKLFVSRRTVDNHLQRAYTKLGIRGRRELAERLVTPASSESLP